jgi:hypothetical protein
MGEGQLNGESAAKPVLQSPPMPLEVPPESSPYRVTLFFGPEPVDGQDEVQACVFNVKKRSWKAGIQVAIEVGLTQLTLLRDVLHLREELTQALETVNEEERLSYEARSVECFTQAICRCKLDLSLCAGLAQENQRVPAGELVSELTQAVMKRREYVFSYVFTELDLAPHRIAPSS